MTNPLLVHGSLHLNYLFLLAGGKCWYFVLQDLATGIWEIPQDFKHIPVLCVLGQMLECQKPFK